MSNETDDDISSLFVLRVVQHWGQSNAERIEAAQKAVNAAGI